MDAFLFASEFPLCADSSALYSVLPGREHKTRHPSTRTKTEPGSRTGPLRLGPFRPRRVGEHGLQPSLPWVRQSPNQMRRDRKLSPENGSMYIQKWFNVLQ